MIQLCYCNRSVKFIEFKKKILIDYDVQVIRVYLREWDILVGSLPEAIGKIS